MTHCVLYTTIMGPIGLWPCIWWCHYDQAWLRFIGCYHAVMSFMAFMAFPCLLKTFGVRYDVIVPYTRLSWAL